MTHSILRSAKFCLLFLILGSVLLLISCNKDSDQNEPKWKFINQSIQGTINSSSWSANSSSLEVWGNDLFLVSFSNENSSESCDYSGGGFEVFFTVPNQIGLYELFFNLNEFDGQTVTFYDSETFENLIATEGAIEILSISETGLTGRIDARFPGNGSFVNGNFTVMFCEDSGYEFIDQPMTGLISNSEWTPQTSFMWEDENYPNTMTIQMSSSDFPNPCNEWSASGQNLSFRVGNTAGLYLIDSQFLSEYFFYFIDDDIDFWEDAKSGAIEILTISESEISGRLDVRYNSGNEVNGNFTVNNLCP